MQNVKIMNPVDGETPEQRVERCANNLLKAVLAAGADIRKTSAISGIDVDVFAPNEYHAKQVLRVSAGFGGGESGGMTFRFGKPSVRVEHADMFTPKYEESETKED